MKLRKASIGRLRMNDTSAKIQNNDILSRFNFDAANFPDMKGYSGSQGYTGSVGFRGSLGAQGDIGFNGSIGFKGSLGPRGYTGSKGFTGSTGEQGYRGSVGDNGLTGIQGAVGERGYTGSRGPLGLTGSAGYTGSTGFRGSLGAQGDLGYTGSVGFTGSKGYTGSRLGSVGLRGSLGYRGSQGYTGSSTGPTGYTGSEGIPGFQGSRGPLGLQGSVGPTGYTGSAGFTGSVGATGVQGVRGSVGARGPVGFRGSVGYTGSRGLITLEGYKWEPIRTRTSGTSLTLIGTGTTEATFAISTGTIAAGDVIAMELNSSASVSTDSTPKIMMFMIANDSTVTEVDHQHGWTEGFINETPEPDFWYSYLRTFGVAYASTTTLRFDNMHTTSIFWSATSWGSTILDLTNLSLYGGRMWKLVPNDSSDANPSNPTISSGFGGTCTYFSFENQSVLSVNVTNNHDQTAIIQFDSTSFISSGAQEVALAPGQTRTFTATFAGNITGTSRTVAARAYVGGNFSQTVTRTETVFFCQSF